jgi:hypothetical protein
LIVARLCRARDLAAFLRPHGAAVRAFSRKDVNQG